MSKFERGITDKAFIAKLNSLLLEENNFWNTLVHDKDLFIAIRPKYLSVYHRGNSICNLSFKKDTVLGLTHYKFLLNPDLNEYVQSRNGEFIYPNLTSKFLSSLDEIKLIKKASKIYAGLEKAGVHSILMNEKNALDIEIELISTTNKIDKIDFLTLEEIHDSIKLVFHEAKHFSYRNVLRDKESPPVLIQLKNYQQALIEHAPEIINSYRVVCENLKELKLLQGRKLVEKVADGAPLSIDFEPRLIIFGFDQDQEDGKVWNPHKIKLKTALGNRLRTIGNV